MAKAAKQKSAKAEAPATQTVSAFKAFDSDLKCRDHAYEVGKTYVIDGKPVLCDHGFHACENPLDVLNYYDLCGSRFARVTLSGALDRQEDGGKICAASITIDAELSLPEWIAASIKWVMDACKTAKGDLVQSASGNFSKLAASGTSSKLAASGDSSQLAASGTSSKLAASGDSSKLAASGNSSQLAASGTSSKLAASGNFSKLAASGTSSKLAASGTSSKLAASGDSSKLAASGYSSQLAASGDYSKLAASGNSSKLAASGYSSKLAASGYSSKLAASGDSSQLAASGDYSKLAASGNFSKLEITGAKSAAATVGPNSRVKAAAGTPVAICEYDSDYSPIGFATGIAGKDFPADTWVIAKDGKLVEAD